MKLQELLSSLRNVKKKGAGRWVACCPAHEDRSPSLAVTATNDSILIHCFAGCDTEDVLGAVGLTFDDMYPDHNRMVRPGKINIYDAFECIAFESMVVCASAGTLRQRSLTEAEVSRLMTASSRIQAARDMV